MILAVGVVIPAQNEAELIGNSLRGLRVALNSYADRFRSGAPYGL